MKEIPQPKKKILEAFIKEKDKGFLYANYFYDDEIKPQELQMHCMLLVI